MAGEQFGKLVPNLKHFGGKGAHQLTSISLRYTVPRDWTPLGKSPLREKNCTAQSVRGTDAFEITIPPGWMRRELLDWGEECFLHFQLKQDRQTPWPPLPTLDVAGSIPASSTNFSFRT